jgi:hypothetical protein
MKIIECPHCKEFIEIIELNCKIFRHGVFIDSGIQISPHASKDECDKYVAEDKIYGCGKPFQIILEGEEYIVLVCEYI